jgi:hypothetical protein
MVWWQLPRGRKLHNGLGNDWLGPAWLQSEAAPVGSLLLVTRSGTIGKIRSQPACHRGQQIDYRTNRLMLLRETVAVLCENHAKHTYTLRGHNTEF